jgi:hypothetical protein
MTHVRKLTPFMILNRNNLLKDKLPSGIIFKCNEERWREVREIRDSR